MFFAIALGALWRPLGLVFVLGHAHLSAPTGLPETLKSV